MSLAELVRFVAITTIFAANVDGQLEFENLPTKLNYQSTSRSSYPRQSRRLPSISSTCSWWEYCASWHHGCAPDSQRYGLLRRLPHQANARAHCCSLHGWDIQYVSVRTHFVSGTEDDEQIKVVNKTRHPKHASETNSYDFLVLELEKASSFPPVALAKADDSDVTAGGNATVMGWSATSQGGNLSTELLRVEVPLVNNTACAKVLNVDNTMLCARGELDMDSCQGNSGGPLLAEQSTDDVLIGVVS